LGSVYEADILWEGKNMRNGFRLKLSNIILFIICILLSVNAILVPKHTAAAKDQEQKLTILFTHDLHDNLLPFQTIENGEVRRLGGYARLASVIKEQKKKDPDALLVDGGDFSMGTPFQTIFTSDAPELRILGALGYDVTTFGNHEFDYRPDGLTGSLKVAISSKEKLPVIVSSNIQFPLDQEGKLTDSLTELKEAMEDYGVRDYIVLERGGLKIGVFGVMGEESESMAPMSGVTFDDEIEQAKRVVKILKEEKKVDFILCLSHSGTKDKAKDSEDEILARKVPEINMIVSGHTHTTLEEPILAGNTIIGSVGSYGRYLGCVKLNREGNGNWKLKNYSLIPIDDSKKEDSKIKDLVQSYKEIVQKKYFDQFDLEYDEKIAYSDFRFQTPDEISGFHGEATIGNLLSDAYIYAVKKAEGDKYIPIDAAVVPNGTIRDTIFSGEVTTANAFSISSLGIGADGMPGYPLISVYLNGKEMKTLCEVDASITPIMGEAQLYMSGMNFTFNPNRLIFNKVTDVKLMKEDGSTKELEDKKLYRIVCNLYSAQMLSVVGDKSFGLMSIVPKNQDGKAITDYEDYIIYSKEKGKEIELKEWYAIVEYLRSFDKTNGVSVIPSVYEKTQGRKIIQEDTSLSAILSKPNNIGIAVDIIAAVLLAIIILCILRITTGKKRRRSRKGRKSQTRRSSGKSRKK
jgi:2',3'-cyclic-nucleotide 2'-phosphodiesterase (5'-nucleotidase family)